MRLKSLLLSVLVACLAGSASLLGAAPAQADFEGAFHHCAVKQPGGTVWCWGMSMSGQVSSALPNQFDNPGEPYPRMATGTPVAVPGVSGARSVAVSDSATCALLLTGEVKCWGQGPLGDGSSTHSPDPVTVSGLSDATAISLGGAHACALRAGGQVVCWGQNNHGQLGDGSTNDAAAPVVVSGISDAIAVSAGRDASCAVISGGSVRCWGKDNNNQLGDGGVSDALTPVTIAGLTDVASIGVQGEALCAAQVDGDVICAGGFYGSGMQLPMPAPVKQFAFGGQIGCVLFTSGRIGCAGGSNDFGQLGDGTFDLPPAFATSNVVGIEDATSVTVGAMTACATHANGDVSCWGFGAYGGVGTGHYVLVGAPTNVPGVGGASELTAGTNHVCALGSGQLSCWGSNAQGQIDTGSSRTYWSPVSPAGHSGVLAIDAFDRSTCAIEADHHVACWGAWSQVTGDTTITDAVGVQTTGSATCALRAGGTVSCWGAGGFGQLGNGDTSDHGTPVDVTGISDATQITSGDQFTCALRAGGTVACWGYGQDGRLGNGDTNQASTPVTVTGLSDAVSISAGERHACAARATGEVACWGWNDDGQLGDGTTTESSVPVVVSGIHDATSVAAGPHNSCVIRQGGTVSCWGAGRNNGQLAFDTNPVDSAVPVAIPGVASATALAVSRYTICALRSGGTVVCWGMNDEGQLGDGLMPEGHGPQPTPHKVIGFGWGGPDTSSDDTAPPPAPAGPPADDSSPTPPAITQPSRAVPPVLFPPSNAEALLAGRRITINAKVKLRKGQRCTGAATATTSMGRTTYRVTLRLKAQGRTCHATGTITLKRTPSLRTRLRITIRTKRAETRVITTRRS